MHVCSAQCASGYLRQSDERYMIPDFQIFIATSCQMMNVYDTRFPGLYGNIMSDDRKTCLEIPNTETPMSFPRMCERHRERVSLNEHQFRSLHGNRALLQRMRLRFVSSDGSVRYRKQYKSVQSPSEHFWEIYAASAMLYRLFQCHLYLPHVMSSVWHLRRNLLFHLSTYVSLKPPKYP